VSGPARKTVRVLISGRVQGVFFRSWTVDRALVRGLDGWVRNRRDGDVEALFAGPADAVDRMLEACWRGPDYARVVDVRVEPAEDPGPTGFEQAATQ
jgi:acylphosphatase